jgi:signal transduction histidine kinase
MALCGLAVWAAWSADTIPLNQGRTWAILGASCVALVASAGVLRGPLQSGEEAAPRHRSARLRSTVAASSLAVGLLLFGVLLHWLGRDLVESSIRQRLEEHATLNESLLRGWILDTSGDIRNWSEGPEMAAALQRHGPGASASREQQEQAVQSLRNLARTWRYVAISVRDPETGARWLSTRTTADSADAPALALRLAAPSNAPGQPVSIEVGSESAPGAPVELSFARAVGARAGARGAIVQVDVHVEESPFRVIRTTGADSSGVDLLVVRREGHAARVIHDSTVAVQRLPLRRLATTDSRSIWAALIRQGDRGFVSGLDVNGQGLLAFSLPVGGTRWLAVAMTPEARVLGQLNRAFTTGAVMAELLAAMAISWWMLYRRQAASERRSQRERVELAERVADLSRRVVSAQEEERHRLAMDLHDRTAANLAAINLNLKCFAMSIPASETDTLQLLQENSELLSETVVTIRGFCSDLRPVLLDYAGLIAAVRSAAAQFEARTGIRVEVEHEGPAARCDPDIESAAFRIVQEALLNCAKHSGAAKVNIQITVHDDRLKLEIRDDGKGFDLDALGTRSQAPGHGLLNMRDRATLAGGELRFDSAPGEGTRVRVVMPWKTPVNGG